MTARIGRFFLFIGLVLLTVFFASDLAASPRFNLFFLGLGGVVIGILLIRRGRPPREPSARFRLVRHLFAKKPKGAGGAGSDAEGGEASG